MARISDQFIVADVEFVRVDSPETLCCWVPVDAETNISIVAEPPTQPSPRTLELAAYVIREFHTLVDSAVTYMCTKLRERQYGLTADELRRLSEQPAPFAEPEAVIWCDETWMMRFVEVEIMAVADEYGIGVNFVGSRPQSLEILIEAEPVLEDQDAAPCE